jgi:class 3 adenylate cyclase/tetratricopeptide (TPR) repeat protein
MRKTVTVLFCDVAGSTELGERLDPEALRAVMTRWFDAMRTPVERAGGTVEKFVGDAVMAVFGVPAAHEDDAFRAVQAAVEMRDAAVPHGLGIRIGVNTGEVVTGDGATTLVTGDAVNTAKRLEEAAAPGEILIGAPTRRLVANATVLEPAGAVSAKGKREPVEAWRVVSTIAGATPYARRLDAPLVGRADELALLESEVDAAVRDRACRLVTVCAPAGVGKSRLAQELLARVDADVLSARCVPYGDGITFLPLRELLGEVAGGSNDEIFLDVRRRLQEKARQRPLLVCIEDVHWAQPAFLDLLEYVHGWARDAPITLLCLARPELYDLRPRWPGRMLTLEPLSTRESESLLDALDVPAAARARIVDAAEGNPLFLEQMVAMLADEAPADEMPPTIHALLTARLDRLEPFEQSVLQRAAVVGKDFSRNAVVELSPEDERAEVAATLLSLTRKELVRPDHSGFADDDGFRFRHALIRDAAYAEVPKGVRTELHARFAAWLEPREATPELVGYHLEQAYRSGVELGAPDDELAARAFELLATAGRRAYARDDVKAAANLLQRAADLVSGDTEVLILLGSAYIAAGDFAQGRAALLEAQEAAAGDRRLELRAAVELGFHDALTGSASSTTQIVGVAERAIPMLRELGDDAGLSRAWQLVTDADVGGKWAERTTALERALDHAERAGDRRQRSSLVALLAQALHYGPTPVETAIVRCDELLAAAEGDRALAAALMSTLGGLNAMRGEFDRARSLWSQARTLYEELGLQHRRAVRSLVPAGIELLAGNPGAAERELRYGYDTLAAMGETWVRATIAAYLAAVLAQLERNDEAIALTRESEANSSDDDVVTQVVWRGARARALARTDPAAAKALALAAVGRALATDFLDLRAGAYVDLAAVADPSAAAAAVAEYERKGNVVGAERARALATI